LKEEAFGDIVVVKFIPKHKAIRKDLEGHTQRVELGRLSLNTQKEKERYAKLMYQWVF